MNIKLTKQQTQITHHLSGHAMVKAGPGCAKTSTLALRIKHLIKTGVMPCEIVILTHSKALIEDIQKTLRNLLKEELAEQVTVQTIHGFAFKLIREVNTTGLDQEVLKGCVKNRLIKRYAKKYALKLPDLKKAFYLFEQGKNKKAKRILGNPNFKQAEMAFTQYQDYKRKHMKLDFEDMITEATKLLKSKPNVKSWLTSYRHLMVDEIQDINGPQKEFLLKLAMQMKSTVLVGDRKQAIYEWRGALLRNWKELEQTLKPKYFELTRTFRIPQQSLDFVNAIGLRTDKNAGLLRSNIKGKKPQLIECMSQDDQYTFLAQEIKRLIELGRSPRSIAILARSNKEISQTAIALRSRDISVNERNRPTNNRHREHLWALIQLTIFRQQLNQKKRKQIKEADIANARDYVDKLFLGQKLKEKLKERFMKKPEKILSIESTSKYYHQINKLAKAIQCAARLGNPESAIQCLIDGSKPLLKISSSKPKQLLRDFADIKLCARQCVALSNVLVEWFDAFEPDTVNSIDILTVHSAKGKEWDYTFLINVVDGVYPHYLSKKQERENLRSFYVAITRHHSRLYMIQAPVAIRIFRKKGAKRPKNDRPLLSKPSPFINCKQQNVIHRQFPVKK
jgi:DNA helicase-2/ATP-dependent DNA helicase PcrA